MFETENESTDLLLHVRLFVDEDDKLCLNSLDKSV